MPIFGKFSELPLPDVISLITKSSGKLDVWRYSSQHHYELFLTEGQVRLLRFNEQELVDSIQTKSFLKNLVQASDGEFEFIRGAGTDGPHRFAIDEVLRIGLAEADEIALYRTHFAEPDTIFSTTGAPPVWLDGELSEFWAASRSVFAEGASAQMLFERLGLYLDQILLKMYKLRSAGMIEPLRATADAPSASAEELEPTSEPVPADLTEETTFPNGDFIVADEEPQEEVKELELEVVSGSNHSKGGFSHRFDSVDLYTANESTMMDLMRAVQASMTSAEK